MSMHSKNIILHEKASEVYLTYKLSPSRKSTPGLAHTPVSDKSYRGNLLTASHLLREVIYYL